MPVCRYIHIYLTVYGKEIITRHPANRASFISFCFIFIRQGSCRRVIARLWGIDKFSLRFSGFACIWRSLVKVMIQFRKTTQAQTKYTSLKTCTLMLRYDRDHWTPKRFVRCRLLNIIKAAKYEIQKPSTCRATLFRCKFWSIFRGFHLN